MKIISILNIFILIIFAFGCERNDLYDTARDEKNPVTVEDATSKSITAFSFVSPAVSGAINEAAHTIAVTVPYGTDITALIATFSTTGVSVYVGAVSQNSGATVNDFTNPVVYTVFAGDGSEQDYTVTVAVDPGAPYEIKHEIGAASAWFGGDNRVVGGPRDVGDGQSVFIDTNIILESFSFYFDGQFDYVEFPEGIGHGVTLTLNIRNSIGNILKTVQVFVPASYNGGWVTWTGIDLDVAQSTTLIFTAYLVGAYDTDQYTTSINGESPGTYAGGSRYSKVGTGDADMELWSGWAPDTWDLYFWLQGTAL